MNIAIFHHHLNQGGVSRVVARQLSALAQRSGDANIKVVIFHGGRAALEKEFAEFEENLSLELIEIPQLEYDALRDDFSNDHQLASSIEKELTQRDFDKTNSILHFHNHSLGKNRAVIPAINVLAKSGRRIFLQIHDMAEDFRAENYRLLSTKLPQLESSMADVLPIAHQVRFGVINKRDEKVLEQTGISSASIDYLPNSVSPDEDIPDQQTAKRAFADRHQIDADVPLLLYPVRGIRRKNIGEAILLTLVSRDQVYVGTTLAPANPIEHQTYQRWKDLCADLRLPVLFDLGNQAGVSFIENIAAADAILTTSVAEGFGLVFLESFAWGKPLIGRDIPLITSDFKQSGVEFEQLYSELRIPIELINGADFDQELRAALNETYHAFEKTVCSAELNQYFDEIRHEGWIDFARLTVNQQHSVITSAARDPRVREMIRDANPLITDWVSGLRSNSPHRGGESMAANRAIVEEFYCGRRAGDTLFKIYTDLLKGKSGEVKSNPKPEAVLDYFLSIENFHPLRVETSASAQPQQTEHKYFGSIIKESLSEISPIATGVTPKLSPIAEVKAVLFDIYGTLLVSSSGDVGTDPAFSDQRKSNDPKLDQMLKGYGTNVQAALALVKLEIKKEHQQLRTAGIPSPEIDIREIWKSVLMELSTSRAATENAEPPMGILSAHLREIALRTELLTNPVWKMPGFDSCLREIHNRNMPLGIISNAQFYTSAILEALADKSLNELGFCDPLSHFSYRIGRAKPDAFLYKVAAKSLQRYGIAPEQVLYVGNDVTKDMIPAKATGFQTGLFAGDQRSLRCGDHGDPQHHQAIDLIFTDLDQITTVLR